jgi:riboflavin transporter FmnP
MKNSRKQIIWMTRTAIFIALLMVVQFATKPLGQLVTGSLVNLILIVSALTCGLSSGLTVAVISPVIATLVGIGPPFWVLTPFIILGNGTIVLIWHFVGNRIFHKKYVGYIASLAAGAVCKFLVLYFSIVRLAVPLFLDLNEKQAGVITASFSFPQLFTALIGGALAIAIIPVIKKAMKEGERSTV